MELEKHAQELVASQEDVKLAAEIGQSLMIKAQDMNVQLRSDFQCMSENLSEAKEEIEVRLKDKG